MSRELGEQIDAAINKLEGEVSTAVAVFREETGLLVDSFVISYIFDQSGRVQLATVKVEKFAR